MKNWRTTLAGLGTGFLYAFVAAMQGGLKPKDAVIAGGLALIGGCAKDHNVTGGSVKQ